MENNKEVRLFVYGTLKENHGNHFFLNGCKKLGTGWLEGFEMWSSGIPYVYYSDDPKSKVYGEIYSVPWSVLTGPIDRLEGHPSFYKREFINQLDGVWVYLCDSRDSYHTQKISNGIY